MFYEVRVIIHAVNKIKKKRKKERKKGLGGAGVHLRVAI